MIIVSAKGSSFTSKLIGWITRFIQTHFAIRYEGDKDQILIHSETGGVQLVAWNDFKNRFSKHISWKVKIDVAEQATDNILLKIGEKPYDYFALYGLGILLFLKKIGIKLTKNILGSSSKYMCSEVIIELIEECKRLDSSLSDLVSLDSEVTTIQELVAYLDSYPQYFERI